MSYSLTRSACDPGALGYVMSDDMGLACEIETCWLSNTICWSGGAGLSRLGASVPSPSVRPAPSSLHPNPSRPSPRPHLRPILQPLRPPRHRIRLVRIESRICRNTRPMHSGSCDTTFTHSYRSLVGDARAGEEAVAHGHEAGRVASEADALSSGDEAECVAVAVEAPWRACSTTSSRASSCR